MQREIGVMQRLCKNDVDDFTSKADDWVIATGETNSVRDFVSLAFNEVGVKLEFKGKGLEEKAYVAECNGDYKLDIGSEVLSIDPNYFRPTEVDVLIGDPTKAKEKLGWVPEYSLKSLVKDMVGSDLKLMEKELLLKKNGTKS